jgi:hypothetical protein
MAKNQLRKQSIVRLLTLVLWLLKLIHQYLQQYPHSHSSRHILGILILILVSLRLPNIALQAKSYVIVHLLEHQLISLGVGSG